MVQDCDSPTTRVASMQRIPETFSGPFLLAKVAQIPNAPSTKKNDRYRIEKLTQTGVLRHLTDKETFKEELRNMLQGKNATSESSFKVHIDALHRVMREFTEADMLRTIDALRADVPEPFLDPWDDAKKVQRFKSVIFQPLTKLRDNWREEFNSIYTPRRIQVMSKRQKERYVPYDDLLARFTELEGKYRPCNTDRKLCSC